MQVGTRVRVDTRMGDPCDLVGKVTSCFDAALGFGQREAVMWSVRWPDGVQTAHEEHELIYVDHPDWTNPEEVEAWLTN